MPHPLTLARSFLIIFVTILALTAFDSPRAIAQTACASTPIDMSTMDGSWSSTSDCHSPNRPIDPESPGDGIYYAVYYDFYVSRTSEVTITLESSTDTYLYLLTGAGRNGKILAKNDDINYDADNLNSSIVQTLEPDNYSIEATTYAKESIGEFTLTVKGIDFATPDDNPDRVPLIAFYNATNGDNWHRSDNWLTDAPISEWYGVQTNDDGRVEKLLLEVNNMSGQIPSELSTLDYLTTLSLYDNQLTGAIPVELANLNGLEELYFGNNQLTGAIPVELSTLTNLVILDLGNNQLTGSIPQSTHGRYPRRTNQLTGAIPVELSTLTNLVILDLGNNQLTGSIPVELANLNGLEELDFGSNQLAGEIPVWLANIESLKRISLNDNQFTGHIPLALADIDRLKTLNLGGNQLTGSVPPELANLSNLTSLILRNNQLTGTIPTQLSEITSLETLDIGYNQFTGEIPPELGKLNNLWILTLARNQLTGEIPSELGSLSETRVLWLFGNQLTGEIPASFSNLTNMQRLLLQGNQLTGEIPPWLGDIEDLYELRLNDNQFTGCIPDALQDVEKNDFDQLNLSFCDDAPPPPASSECTQSISASAAIQSQWTSNCVSRSRTEHGEYYAKYYTFTLGRPTTVEALLESRTDSYILLLDSDGETVTENDDYKYRNAGFLTALKPGEYTIEATTYSTSESGDFTLTLKQPELDALYALYNAAGGANWDNNDSWLTGAPLSEWHGVKTDEEGRVIEIYLIDNNLSGEIPRELGNISELQWLFLSRNSLSGSVPQELGNLHNLKILMLSNNELTGSIPALLGNMAALEELHLGRNQLSGSVPASLGRLENLRKLSLTANKLSGNIPTQLANLSSLRTLSIAANELSGPIPHQLTDMENLTHIYLWGNDLTEGSFVRYLGNLKSLKFLDIGGNSLDGAEVLAELYVLPNLTGLGLHDSSLSDTALLRHMDDLQTLNLEFLNLSGNGLSDLQILIGLSRITTLQRIAINDNDFSGELPRTMTHLTLMRLFYFHDNDGICAPDDSEFQDWLRGSPEIREFLRGGYPDVKGPTCTSSTTPANAPMPNSADQFAAVLQTPEQLVPPHSMSSSLDRRLTDS
jgi:Leucine-rich repeat (LRR) protein